MFVPQIYALWLWTERDVGWQAADIFLFFILFLFLNLELNIFLRYATAAYAIGAQVSASMQFHDVLTNCLSTMFPRSEHTRECYQDEWYCVNDIGYDRTISWLFSDNL